MASEFVLEVASDSDAFATLRLLLPSESSTEISSIAATNIELMMFLIATQPFLRIHSRVASSKSL